MPAQLPPPHSGRAGWPKGSQRQLPEGEAAASGSSRNLPSLPATISSSPRGALGGQTLTAAAPRGGKGGRQGGGVSREPKRRSQEAPKEPPLTGAGADPQLSNKRARITTEAGKSKSEVIVVISRNPAGPLPLPCPLGPPRVLGPLSHTPEPQKLDLLSPASQRDGAL